MPSWVASSSRGPDVAGNDRSDIRSAGCAAEAERKASPRAFRAGENSNPRSAALDSTYGLNNLRSFRTKLHRSAVGGHHEKTVVGRPCCRVGISAAVAETELEENLDQVRLSQASDANAATVAARTTELKLVAPLDVSQAFNSGTLFEQVSALQPLQASMKKQRQAQSCSRRTRKPIRHQDQMASQPGHQRDHDFQKRLSIDVCSDQSGRLEQARENIPREAVRATWSTMAASRLSAGKTSAPNNAQGIKILIADDRPKSTIRQSKRQPHAINGFEFHIHQSRNGGLRSEPDSAFTRLGSRVRSCIGVLARTGTPLTPKWCVKLLGKEAISKPLAALQAKMAS